MAPRLLAPLSALLWILGLSAGVHASDFWDEVRTPGLRAHAARMDLVAAAVRRDEGHHALELLKQVAPHFQQHANVLLMRGFALALGGDAEAAVALLRQARGLEPLILDDAAWGTRAALIATKANDYAMASDVLARVVGGLPALPLRRELYAMLGDTLLTQGPSRLAEAIVAYREATRATNLGEVRGLLGLALALSRNEEAAAVREVLSRLTAASRVDVVINALPVPAPEKAARMALALEAAGDTAGAIAQWQLTTVDTTWSAHAEAEIARLRQSAPARKRGRTP